MSCQVGTCRAGDSAKDVMLLIDAESYPPHRACTLNCDSQLIGRSQTIGLTKESGAVPGTAAVHP